MVEKDFFEIRDAVWGSIPFPKALAPVLETDEFRRLGRIKQLGPTHLLYPCATHTRFSHSLGVAHLGRCLLNHLIRHGEVDLDETDKKTFFAACLFHDIGHYPYTHSLKELHLIEHEKAGGDLICREKISAILSNFGINATDVAAIIDTDRNFTGKNVPFFRKLLSGVLDVDKIDYLTRDAFFCGVPYGTQSYDPIFSSLIPHHRHGIILDEKDILHVEQILFSKYMMYRAVYWHPRVRIATAMMKKALYWALKQKIIHKEDLFSADDEEIVALLCGAEFEGSRCVQGVKRGEIFKVVEEENFDPANEEHIQLENLEARSTKEIILAEKYGVSPAEIVIDIPEKISFESQILIRDRGETFSQVSKIFSEKTVTALSSSLRKIRVAVALD